MMMRWKKMMVMKQMNLRTMEKVCVDALEQTLSYCWQPEETHLQRAHRHTEPQCISSQFFLQQSTATNAVWYVEKWQPEETHLQRAHWHTEPQCIPVEVFFFIQMNCTNTATMVCWKMTIWIITSAESTLAHGAIVHSSRIQCKFFSSRRTDTIHCDKYCVICWKMSINQKNHICRESSSSQQVFLEQMNCSTIQVFWSEVFSSLFFSFGCF